MGSHFSVSESSADLYGHQDTSAERHEKATGSWHAAQGVCAKQLMTSCLCWISADVTVIFASGTCFFWKSQDYFLPG